MYWWFVVRNTTNHCIYIYIYIYGSVILLYHKHVARYTVDDTTNVQVCMYTPVSRIPHNVFLSAPLYDASIVCHCTSFRATTTAKWRILKHLKGTLSDVIVTLLWRYSDVIVTSLLRYLLRETSKSKKYIYFRCGPTSNRENS